MRPANSRRADPLDLEALLLADLLPLSPLLGSHQCDGLALTFRPAGPPDAVDVRLRPVGNLVVDHPGDIRDVETPGRHVRGDEDADFALAKGLEDAEADVLLLIPVKGAGAVAVSPHHPVEIDRLATRVGEDDGRVLRVLVEDLPQGVELARELALDVLLGDLRNRDDTAHRGVRLRIAHVAGQQRVDLGRNRRREDERLPLRWRAVEDGADVLDETHVQHAVRLVEDHRVTPGEGEDAVPEELEHPAGRPDDHLSATAQLLDLLARVHAADDQRDTHASLPAQFLEYARDLQREFPGRREHERLHRHPLRIDPADDGSTEADGLAGSRLGLTHDVDALENRLDHVLLDRGRRDQVQPFQSLQNFRLELIIRESPGRFLCVVHEPSRKGRRRLGVCRSLKSSVAGRPAVA